MTPATFRNLVFRYSCLSACTFCAGIGAGWLINFSGQQRIPSLQLMNEVNSAKVPLFQYVLDTNLRSFLGEIRSIWCFGLPAVLFLVSSGLQLGVFMHRTGLFGAVITVAPHGIIEMLAFITNAGATFSMAHLGIVSLIRKEIPDRNIFSFYCKIVMGSVLALVGAAFIEAFVTPLIASHWMGGR